MDRPEPPCSPRDPGFAPQGIGAFLLRFVYRRPPPSGQSHYPAVSSAARRSLSRLLVILLSLGFVSQMRFLGEGDS